MPITIPRTFNYEKYSCSPFTYEGTDNYTYLPVLQIRDLNPTLIPKSICSVIISNNVFVRIFFKQFYKKICSENFLREQFSPSSRRWHYLWENLRHETWHLLLGILKFLRVSLRLFVLGRIRTFGIFPIWFCDFSQEYKSTKPFSNLLIFFCSSSVNYKYNIWNSDTCLCNICC